MKVGYIQIHQATGIGAFEVGQKLLTQNEEEQKTFVVSIDVNIFGTVKVKISDGKVLVYRRFPVQYVIE